MNLSSIALLLSECVVYFGQGIVVNFLFGSVWLQNNDVKQTVGSYKL